jgi:hypothetical protein
MRPPGTRIIASRPRGGKSRVIIEESRTEANRRDRVGCAAMSNEVISASQLCRFCVVSHSSLNAADDASLKRVSAVSSTKRVVEC